MGIAESVIVDKGAGAKIISDNGGEDFLNASQISHTMMW